MIFIDDVKKIEEEKRRKHAKCVLFSDVDRGSAKGGKRAKRFLTWPPP